MNAGRTGGTCRGTAEWLRSAVKGTGRLAWPLLAIVVLLSFAAGTASYPFFSPEEARHAGIAHDMWAARQYLVPSVDGFPVMDGAPLYYWVTLVFLSLFESQEWVLRLPSAMAGAALLVFLGKVFFPPSQWRLAATLAALFLLQPALLLAGRFASPDMLVLLLLTVAVGSFYRATQCLEQNRWCASWRLTGWGATALLGLAAGPLSMSVPLLLVGLWLALRRRPDLRLALYWWPGVLLVVLVLLPWGTLVETRYPGIIAAMLHKQSQALTSAQEHGCVGVNQAGCWLMLLAACLPLLVCLYRFWTPHRRAALRTPLGGLMAVWLVILLPLHALLLMSPVGHAVALMVPLLYFASLAMVPVGGTPAWSDAIVWLGVGLLALTIGVAGKQFLAERLSETSSLTQIISQLYNRGTDKAIMIDRFDYDFNFYMRSPKMVYVATDWTRAGEEPASRWMQELSESARFVPETASRLLLDTGSAQSALAAGKRQQNPTAKEAAPELHGLLERLCEPRMVNLWVIGASDAAQRHPFLKGLTPVVATGTIHAWYLGAGRDLIHCAEWLLNR